MIPVAGHIQVVNYADKNTAANQCWSLWSHVPRRKGDRSIANFNLPTEFIQRNDINYILSKMI